MNSGSDQPCCMCISSCMVFCMLSRMVCCMGVSHGYVAWIWYVAWVCCMGMLHGYGMSHGYVAWVWYVALAGMVEETILGVILTYVPFCHIAFMTAPLDAVNFLYPPHARMHKRMHARMDGDAGTRCHSSSAFGYTTRSGSPSFAPGRKAS